MRSPIDAATAEPAQNPAASARSCGTCTLCCKVLKIAELDKPQNVWCPNCKQGVGCLIYSDRPRECRSFACGWLTDFGLGEEWRPSHSKIVLVSELDGKRIAAYVDPQRPDAWKKEPYYSKLKQWAVLAVPHGGQVVASVGRRIYMVFPDRDVDLGIGADDEVLVTSERMTARGLQLEAFKVHKDDPRLRDVAAQQSAARSSKNESGE
jgi:hypothetical protein